jgi:hypothetical protein
MNASQPCLSSLPNVSQRPGDPGPQRIVNPDFAGTEVPVVDDIGCGGGDEMEPLIILLQCLLIVPFPIKVSDDQDRKGAKEKNQSDHD